MFYENVFEVIFHPGSLKLKRDHHGRKLVGLLNFFKEGTREEFIPGSQLSHRSFQLFCVGYISVHGEGVALWRQSLPDVPIFLRMYVKSSVSPV